MDVFYLYLYCRDVSKSEYHVWKGNVYYGTRKGNKYEMGGKPIFQCFLSQLYH